MKKFKTLLDLYFTFFKIGLVSFGGGIAMLPILERELSDKRKWVTQDELIDYFAIGQSTPGIIAVNVATFCGYKLAKNVGGVVATLGIVSPALVIISALAHAIDSVNNILWVKKMLMGINAAVAANLTYACINLFRKSIKNIWSAFLFLLSFVLVFFFKVPAVLVIVLSIVLGVGLYFVQKVSGLKKNPQVENSSTNENPSSEQTK